MTDKLLDDSASSRQGYFQSRASLLRTLAEQGQSPEILFICCSDARIVPTQLLGAAPGELFVLRNVANIVPPYWQTEIGVASVLEYAVLVLRVPHIVVCGHTNCGGIESLDSLVDISTRPALSRWLDLARPALLQLDSWPTTMDSTVRHQAIVERHVINQLANLRSYPFIQQSETDAHLELHGWVYYLGHQAIRYYDAADGEFKSL